MKKLIIIGFCLLVVIAAGMLACNNSRTDGIDKDVPELAHGKQDAVKRGHYLVTIMGCNDCHTPTIMTPYGPAKDSSRLLSGHPAGIPLPQFDKSYTQSWALFSLTSTAMAGPWGVSYAANLTSDASGIGNWTEKQFFNAFARGRYKGLDSSRSLLPPMPWQMYSQVADEDISAIFAYLKSTIPVNNVVPACVPQGQTEKEDRHRTTDQITIAGGKGVYATAE